MKRGKKQEKASSFIFVFRLKKDYL